MGLIRREGRSIVSVTSIYNYIHKNKTAGGSLYKHLHHQLKHRKQPEGGYCSIKDRVLIDERPAIVDTRTWFGDWKIDTIVGKERGHRNIDREKDRLSSDGKTPERETVESAGRHGYPLATAI